MTDIDPPATRLKFDCERPPSPRADAGADRAARRGLRLVQMGIFLNYLGYGAVLPFEVIYLHEARGFSLGAAGLAVGLITGVAVVTAPVAGIAATALAAGYLGLACAHSPVYAYLAAAVAGTGNGALNPSQSTLVATLAPVSRRHRATAVSRVAGNAGAGLGAAAGGLVAAHGVPGFVALFAANAGSYLLFACVLLAVVPARRPAGTADGGGYRAVARDRAFVHLAVVNMAMIAVGWGAFTWLVPPYASADLGVGARLIGVLLLANTATVAVAQVPVARLAEGRRRAVTMAVGAAAFVLACVLVAGAGRIAAYPALVAAAVIVGFGECLHTTVLMPLTADLAPAGRRGRYMATMGLSWWAGLAVVPAVGAGLLGAAPVVTFLGAAALAALAGLAALALESKLPHDARRTPRPAR